MLLATAAPAWADDEAQFQQGLAAYNAKNYNRALFLWEPLAEKGYADVQYNLGMMYDVVAQKYQQAFAWYQKAANQGYAKAQYELGDMYYHGKGVANNYQQAFVWYQKAANQGNFDAQFSLGSMYYHGKGVAQNYQQAKAWYQKALAHPDASDLVSVAKSAITLNLRRLELMGVR